MNSPSLFAQQMERRESTGPMQDMFRNNVVVSAAVGMSEFTEGTMEDVTDTGVDWDVRVLWGSRSFIGVEAAYIGASYDTTGARGSSTTLYSNGLETAVRMNLMQISTGAVATQAWQPYVLGGVAWKNYQLDDSLQSAELRSSDDTMEVPVAAGVSFYFPNRLMVDARAAYRFGVASDLVRIGEASTDNWNLSGRVGWMF
ncbi:MAG: outer membrane beta-barrel protein [Oligoflexus sp.]